jgi:hypothetical protein
LEAPLLYVTVHYVHYIPHVEASHACKLPFSRTPKMPRKCRLPLEQFEITSVECSDIQLMSNAVEDLHQSATNTVFQPRAAHESILVLVTDQSLVLVMSLVHEHLVSSLTRELWGILVREASIDNHMYIVPSRAQIHKYITSTYALKRIIKNMQTRLT